jgi:fibronectin type 3 domain-containing protein
MQPKIPENLKTDINLPAPANLITLSDRAAIGLEWESIDDPLIAGYIIYRAEPNANFTRYGAIGTRFSNHFLDEKPARTTPYAYAVSAYTADGRESPRGAPALGATLPALEAVSFVAGGNVLPRRAKIIFRPHPNERVSGYEVERRETGKKADWRRIARLEGRLHAEFIDEDLADDARYEYRVTAVAFDGLKSAPSEIVRTTTKTAPKAVIGLRASSNFTDKIEVRWQRATDDANGFYRVYAASRENGFFRAIADVKAADTAVEKPLDRGETRFYKVTFTDEDGLESALQSKPVYGATLPAEKPKK